jgi:transcriptional regulator with XRE-family HTH domain
MPNIDQAAKAWQVALAKRVGKAVQKRRKSVGLTAQALSARTVEFGYPLTRVAISKIESNQRSGKLDVAELFVLAAALDIPPALLLFDGYPSKEVEVLPGSMAVSSDAVHWLAGDQPIPVSVGEGEDGIITLGEAGDGVLMVQAVNKRDGLRQQINLLDTWLAVATAAGTSPQSEINGNRDARRSFEERYVAADRDARNANDRLWGVGASDAT